jgi:ring-1,2-phenylacetyl-CoA epoxidase subunit PaaE
MIYHISHVTDITSPCKDVRLISLSSPFISTFEFDPGQYINVKAVINGVEIERQYSVCDLQKDKITIGVKKVKSGIMSSYLIDSIKVGDEIEISNPDGRFIVEPKHEIRKSYLFLAAGIGITPIYKMIKEILEQEPKSEICLLYSNKTEKDIVFKSEFDQWKEMYQDQFHVIYTLTDNVNRSFFGLLKSKNSSWTGKTGRITLDFIKENYSSLESTIQKEVYLCGPTEFNIDLEKIVFELGIPHKQIHKEFFHVDQNTEATASQNAMNAQLTFTLDGNRQTIEVKAKEKLLDAMIRQGVNAPHSCSSGACASCVCKLVSGKVSMDISLALDEDEIKDGYILACQARPLSPEIEIQYA